MGIQDIGGRLYRRARQLTRLPPDAWRSLLPSFSQFGEDHALLRLLKPRSTGTYVDVGANEPLEGSNTAFLYSLGWTGLAIDANPVFAPKFRKTRPQDTFLTMGVALEPAELTYFEFENNVFNTLSPERAAQLTAEGTRPVAERRIPCLPLRDIVRQHLPGRRVDLLTVDCEGLDLDVLRSAHLEEMRPTVIMVEDFARYEAFREGGDPGELDRFLRGAGYLPICQLAWSALFVARDWRSHPDRAFRPPTNEFGYMP